MPRPARKIKKGGAGGAKIGFPRMCRDRRDAGRPAKPIRRRDKGRARENTRETTKKVRRE